MGDEPKCKSQLCEDEGPTPAAAELQRVQQRAVTPSEALGVDD